MSDPSLLDVVLIASTAIFFCLWAACLFRGHNDKNYIAMRYALFMLKEPDRASFLHMCIHGHSSDIANRFPGFEIYREQYERSRA